MTTPGTTTIWHGARAAGGANPPDRDARPNGAAAPDKVPVPDETGTRVARLVGDGPKGMLFEGMDLREIGRRMGH